MQKVTTKFNFNESTMKWNFQHITAWGLLIMKTQKQRTSQDNHTNSTGNVKLRNWPLKQLWL